MRYLTDRKRAVGMGASKTGTDHHWSMQMSSIALIVLVPFFIFTFGPILGHSYQEVVAYYSRPWPALIAALTMIVGMMHFKNGCQMALEDYVHGLTGRLLIILINCIAYGFAAASVLALVKIAL